MPPTKATKASGPLKQAKLSFASKRTTSANPAAGGKAAKVTRKQAQPPRTSSSSPSSTEPIVLSDSDTDRDGPSGDAEVAPAPKKRRLNANAQRVAAKYEEESVAVVAEPAAEPEPEREPLKLTDKRWRTLYGAARAQMDHLEPIHANGQSMVHHILRVFDLSYEYGPCVGVSRLDRWERAYALGLNPPPEVKEILMTKEGSMDNQFSQSVFYGEV
ncbi:hypothetical protein GSI_07500 [Ganoderma sinense ZZ0214-1]|uniref:DNA polymerase delta subunit 4 n=1 Tax=Ganoderma sinense ZZ0214-1 TaxID=1077348 RepID=A0A2G8S967_9APHY|nr:hypothetical protein GSI_07500 [Ganoderma sinense ZZ0214-1]